MTISKNLPTRLHHNAYVTADMEATRHFYEDLIGMPLVATWCEADELFGKERVYCHCFFGLTDGSALAFFQFANPDDQNLFGPKMPPSPFHHIALNVDAATQNAVKQRLEAAGYRDPNLYVLEHGYCKSLYAADPNGMILELTVDNPNVASEAAAPARTPTSNGGLPAITPRTTPGARPNTSECELTSARGANSSAPQDGAGYLQTSRIRSTGAGLVGSPTPIVPEMTRLIWSAETPK